MPREPTARDVQRAVERIGRRLTTSHLLEAGTAGFVAGAVFAVAGRELRWTPVAGTAGAALLACVVASWWFLRRRAERTRPAAALRFERAHPESRNAVFTAVELIDHPDRAKPWVRERVLADADAAVSLASPRAVVPIGWRAAVCVVAAALAAAAPFSVDRRAAAALSAAIQQVMPRAGDARASVSIVLEPPAYTRLPAATLSEPERITAVEGTRLRIRVAGPVSRIRFGSTALATRLDRSTTIADHILRESGYLAVEGQAGPRLIPIAVTPDRAPNIKVEKPGRDLLVANAIASIPLETSATDDFGLERLALRYTKVSGSGEQFEFVEGELPLTVAREDARSWRGRAAFALPNLGLEPGDSLVYRVVARDGRPGDAGASASDSYFIEIAGPGQVALEGFEMPPDRERYGLSQQMIVLKIQRLRERERGLARDALVDQTGSLAAEQRAVRANFVFLTGGHVEDEEEEAEQSHEIQEGRLENTARREISRAIGFMTRAEQALIAIDTTTALAQARLAVDALQRAFGRNRYILRTLPVRSRVDPSRRLTGKLDEAKGWLRVLPAAPADPRAQRIRELLADLTAAGSRLSGADRAASAAAVGELPERALAIDPGNPEWQQISAQLIAVRDAVRAGAAAETFVARFGEALTAMVSQVRRVAMPRGLDVDAPDPLRGAWAEELKKR
jgi:hypothetical protein